MEGFYDEPIAACLFSSFLFFYDFLQFCEWEDNDVHDISDVGKSICFTKFARKSFVLLSYLSCEWFSQPTVISLMIPSSKQLMKQSVTLFCFVSFMSPDTISTHPHFTSWLCSSFLTHIRHQLNTKKCPYSMFASCVSREEKAERFVNTFYHVAVYYVSICVDPIKMS